MGFFDRFFKRSAENPANPITIDFDDATGGGTVVNSYSAIQSTPFYAALKLISETIASLPFDIYKKTPEGQQLAETLPARAAIVSASDAKYGRFMFMQKLIASACLNGNGYARILRDPAYNVIGYEYLKHSEVVVDDYTVDGAPVYRVSRTKGMRAESFVLFDFEVIHIPGFSVVNDWGETVTLVHAPTIQQDLNAKNFGNAFFANGIHTPVVIEAPQQVDAPVQRRLRAMWRKLFGGISNAGTPMVLDAGMTAKALPLSMKDSLLVDVRRFTVSDVSRITGVPPHLLHDLERATFNNIEVMNAQFVSTCLVPWCEKIETEFERKTLPEKSRGRYHYEFDLKNLMRGDMEAQSKFYTAMFQIGAMNGDEIRRVLGYNNRPGGDVYYIPVNMMPWDKLEADQNADASADNKPGTNAANSTGNG